MGHAALRAHVAMGRATDQEAALANVATEAKLHDAVDDAARAELGEEAARQSAARAAVSAELAAENEKQRARAAAGRSS